MWLYQLNSTSIQVTVEMHATLSVGKGFGSKGKQRHKHQALETQSYNNWSQQIQSK